MKLIKNYRRRNYYAALDYRLPRSNRAVLLDFTPCPETKQENCFPSSFPMKALKLNSDLKALHKYCINFWSGDRYNVVLISDISSNSGYWIPVQKCFEKLATINGVIYPSVGKKPVLHVARTYVGAKQKLWQVDMSTIIRKGFVFFDKPKFCEITTGGFVAIVLQKDKVFPIEVAQRCAELF